MTPKFKRAFIVEILTLVLSLAPLLIGWLTDTMTAAEPVAQEELPLIYYGLNLYIAYPFLSVLVGMILALCRFEWYLAGLPAGLGFFLSTFVFLSFPILNALLFAVIYVGIGFGVAALVGWLKKRSDERKQYIGKL